MAAPDAYTPYAPPPLPVAKQEDSANRPKRKWIPPEEWRAQMEAREGKKDAGAKTVEKKKSASASLMEKWTGAKPKSLPSRPAATKPAAPSAPAPAPAKPPPPQPKESEEEEEESEGELPAYIITRFLPDGTVMGIFMGSEGKEVVVRDSLKEQYKAKQSQMSQQQRDAARESILAAGTKQPRSKAYDEVLVRLCAPQKTVSSLREMEAYMRYLGLQGVVSTAKQKRWAAHILREYHLPVDFDSAEYFGVRLKVPFEVRVCVSYGLFLLDKKRPDLKPSLFTDSATLPLLSLSGKADAPDYALSRMKRPDFMRLMEKYVQWRRLLTRYLSFADRARLARLNKAFKREFQVPALLGACLRVPRAYASAITEEELFASARICALLLGHALDAFAQDDSRVSQGIGAFPGWLAIRANAFPLRTAGGVLPLYKQILGRSCESLIQKGGHSLLVQQALLCIQELHWISSKTQVKTKRLSIESVLRFRALWATLAGVKPGFRANAGFPSKRRRAGDVELEVERVRDRTVLYLTVRVNGTRRLAGVDVDEGVVYIARPGQRESVVPAPRRNIAVDLGLFKKQLKSALRDKALRASLEGFFRTSATRKTSSEL